MMMKNLLKKNCRPRPDIKKKDVVCLQVEKKNDKKENYIALILVKFVSFSNRNKIFKNKKLCQM